MSFADFWAMHIGEGGRGGAAKVRILRPMPKGRAWNVAEKGHFHAHLCACYVLCMGCLCTCYVLLKNHPNSVKKLP